MSLKVGLLPSRDPDNPVIGMITVWHNFDKGNAKSKHVMKLERFYLIKLRSN